MQQIENLNLVGSLTKAVTDVFETMLSMQMKQSNAEELSTLDGERIVGSVSFDGSLIGNFYIHVSRDFARIMTAVMLGMESDEVKDEDEINDVVGEMSNMIGGNLKSGFCDSGMDCELSIPSITNGDDFIISSLNCEKHERLVFYHQRHTALVEICLRSDK